MASKKLPSYVHCAKCGYRGVDAKHDCTTVRAATAAVVDQAAKRVGIPGVTSQPKPQSDRIASAKSLAYSADAPPRMAPLARIRELVVEHRRLFGRHVAYTEILVEDRQPRPLGTIEIHQRCAACGSDVNKRVHIDISVPFSGIELAGHTRRAYLQHRCPEARAALQGFSYEEIEQLHAELDRELTRIGAYLADVDAIRKEQERATTSRKDEGR